jgi:hypothetical protein
VLLSGRNVVKREGPHSLLPLPVVMQFEWNAVCLPQR